MDPRVILSILSDSVPFQSVERRGLSIFFFYYRQCLSNRNDDAVAGPDLQEGQEKGKAIATRWQTL